MEAHARFLPKNVRIKWLAGDVVPSPPFEVAGGLHVVVAVEEQRRRPGRAGDLAPQRQRAVGASP